MPRDNYDAERGGDSEKEKGGGMEEETEGGAGNTGGEMEEGGNK